MIYIQDISIDPDAVYETGPDFYLWLNKVSGLSQWEKTLQYATSLIGYDVKLSYRQKTDLEAVLTYL